MESSLKEKVCKELLNHIKIDKAKRKVAYFPDDIRKILKVYEDRKNQVPCYIITQKVCYDESKDLIITYKVWALREDKTSSRNLKTIKIPEAFIENYCTGKRIRL